MQPNTFQNLQILWINTTQIIPLKWLEEQPILRKKNTKSLPLSCNTFHIPFQLPTLAQMKRRITIFFFCFVERYFPGLQAGSTHLYCFVLPFSFSLVSLKAVLQIYLLGNFLMALSVFPVYETNHTLTRCALLNKTVIWMDLYTLSLNVDIKRQQPHDLRLY